MAQENGKIAHEKRNFAQHQIGPYFREIWPKYLFRNIAQKIFLGQFSLGLFSKKYRPTFLGYFFGKITQLFFGRFFRKNHPNFLTNFFGKITQKFFKKRKNCPEYRATLSLHNPLRI